MIPGFRLHEARHVYDIGEDDPKHEIFPFLGVIDFCHLDLTCAICLLKLAVFLGTGAYPGQSTCGSQFFERHSILQQHMKATHLPETQRTRLREQWRIYRLRCICTVVVLTGTWTPHVMFPPSQI